MKKFLLSSAIIVLFGFYLFKTFGADTKQEPATSPTTPTTDTSNLQTTNVTTPDQSTATVTVPAATTDTTPAATTPTTTPAATTTTTTQATTPATPTTPVTPTTPKALYKDGSYTGPVTDAVFGDMQVKVTVSGGKITDVTLVKFPNDVANSTKINTNAHVKWKSETIAAQSAKVNIISGATESSVAFRQSLAAALEQAKN